MSDVKIPSFIIAGIQRCGTTSLSRYLSWHPQVHFSIPKEIHYFDRDDRYPNHLWYRDQFDLERLAEKQKNEQQVYVAESTPMYAFWRNSIERIYHYDPEIKLILILRDPVRRVLSHYWMNARKFHKISDSQVPEFEDKMIPTFEEELRRLRKGRPKSKLSFLARGHYYEQIERIYKHFPKEQLLVVRLEDYKQAPYPTLFQVMRYLGIREMELPKPLKQFNRTTYPHPSAEVLEWLGYYYAEWNQRLHDDYGVQIDDWTSV